MKQPVEQALKRIRAAHPQFIKDIALVYTEILALERRNAEYLTLLAKATEVIASDRRKEEEEEEEERKGRGQILT